MLPRQARAVELMLFSYWSNVTDDGPASEQLRFDKSYHLKLHISPLFPVKMSQHITRHTRRVTTTTILAVQSCRYSRFVCTISIFFCTLLLCRFMTIYKCIYFNFVVGLHIITLVIFDVSITFTQILHG